jgi:hypothetical protein
VSKLFRVRVWSLPAWLDTHRFLGPGLWSASAVSPGEFEFQADLSRDAAADLSARLRGVGIGGSLLQIEVLPALQRKDVRHAYREEAKRYRKGGAGFSKRSTQLDDEGRRSLTPEVLALALGQRVRGLRVVDACAGAGGNAIGFARAGCEVVAIEIDAARLAMARHNAGLYGVADRIDFLLGDARDLLPQQNADLLFIDPPWGERYNKERVVLGDLPPCGDLLERAVHIPNQWIKVPPSFAPSCLPDCHVEACFGVGEGDERRVKFLLLQRGKLITPLVHTF